MSAKPSQEKAPQIYFDSDAIREHVSLSRHCQHGIGFTYDFCPIVRAVNAHEQLAEALKSAWATIDALIGDLQNADAWNNDGGEQLRTTQETQLKIDAALALVDRHG